MGFEDLPTLNATLNLVSIVCLSTGYVYIRKGERDRHKACMLAACSVSLAFLVSYVIYHWQAGSRAFLGEGWMRPVYFTILISHIVLAASILPLAGITVTRALRGSFASHRRIARWTFPIWMYVSVTGDVIYVMLYLV